MNKTRKAFELLNSREQETVRKFWRLQKEAQKEAKVFWEKYIRS
jgi:hypothetical protein